MKSATPIRIPLLNPNEPEALLATLHVAEGQAVRAGQPLGTLETTKATADLEAEADGYIVGLRLTVGETVRAGDLLCYLASAPDWQAPSLEHETAPETGSAPQLPPGLRITRPALALAREHSLSLDRLPVGPLVTEAQVRDLVQRATGQDLTPIEGAFNPQGLLIYGGGGHGKMLIDLLRAAGVYHLAGVVDDGLPSGSNVMGVPVLGGSERLAELHSGGLHLAANAVGGIGNVRVRIQVFHRLAEAGFVFPSLVHPRALVEPGATLAPGAQVLAMAYVGSEAQVGFGCIVNTGAIVSHDCRLGDYATVSPGAILAGEVQVGSGALIGMGVTINLGVRVGSRARIGNGATVKGDVPDGGVVRAGMIWPEAKTAQADRRTGNE